MVLHRICFIAYKDKWYFPTIVLKLGMPFAEHIVQSCLTRHAEHKQRHMSVSIGQRSQLIITILTRRVPKVHGHKNVSLLHLHRPIVKYRWHVTLLPTLVHKVVDNAGFTRSTVADENAFNLSVATNGIAERKTRYSLGPKRRAFRTGFGAYFRFMLILFLPVHIFEQRLVYLFVNSLLLGLFFFQFIKYSDRPFVLLIGFKALTLPF